MREGDHTTIGPETSPFLIPQTWQTQQPSPCGGAPPPPSCLLPDLPGDPKDPRGYERSGRATAMAVWGCRCQWGRHFAKRSLHAVIFTAREGTGATTLRPCREQELHGPPVANGQFVAV